MGDSLEATAESAAIAMRANLNRPVRHEGGNRHAGKSMQPARLARKLPPGTMETIEHARKVEKRRKAAKLARKARKAHR